MNSALTLRYMIDFELIFIYSVKKGCDVILLYIVLVLFVQKIVLSLLKCLGTLVKNQVTITSFYNLISSLPLDKSFKPL